MGGTLGDSEKKCAVLLSGVSAQTYILTKNLLSRTSQQTVYVMKNNFQPKLN